MEVLFFQMEILFFRRQYKLQIEVILNTKENFLSIIKLKRFKYEEKIL